MVIRSIRPWNSPIVPSGPAPMGICTGIGWLSSRVGDLVEDPVELGPDPVHLVDEADPRDVVLGRLPPDGLALGFDPLHGREDDDGPVEHAERALDLRREIDVAGRVDDVDRDRVPGGVLPVAGDRRGDDRDSALLFLFEVVGGGGPLVHVAHAVDLARVVQDPLGRRRLAGVDVGDDADVAECSQPRRGGVAVHECGPEAFPKGRRSALVVRFQR